MIRTVLSGFIADESRECSGVGPYQIPYRAMLPKTPQVINLIVPVAFSATHAAFIGARRADVHGSRTGSRRGGGSCTGWPS